MENYQDLQTKFGIRLRKLREERGLSLRELAANCNLNYGKIGDIELGKTNLKLSSMFELAKGLGIELKELMNFDL